MIDNDKRRSNQQAKEKVRRRIRVQIDPDNYEYEPERKPIDYNNDEAHSRVAIYVRVSTDDVRQTTSYELQKKYYEEFVVRHPNITLSKCLLIQLIGGLQFVQPTKITEPEYSAQNQEKVFITRAKSRQQPIQKHCSVCLGGTQITNIGL